MKLSRWIAALAAIACWCAPVRAQDFVQSYNFVNTGTNGPTTSFANSGVTSFFISWSPQASLSACSIQVDSSSDGASWGSGDLIASTSCTTAGSSATATLGAGKNFVRIHVTALTGNGGLNVTMKGWGGGGSGGGITQVSSLPATCTVGQSVFLTVGAGSNAPGQYNCVATNILSFVGTNTGHTINAADLGVTNAGNAVCDASSTINTTTVTTSANDPAFTSAINGWTVWGNAGAFTCIDNTSYTNVVPVGTITFVSAHTATVSVQASATQTGTLHLIWGPNEDAALTAAENAAWNYAPSAPHMGMCYALALSAGFTVIKQPHFNTVSCNNQGTGTLSTGALVFGQSRSTFLLAMTPDFNFAACPTYNSLNTCFGAENGFRKYNFGITGMQDPGTANPAAVTCLLQDGVDSETYNMFLIGGFVGRANVDAYCTPNISPSASMAFNMSVDGMGFLPWNMNGTSGCTFCWFGSAGGSNLILTGTNGGTLTTINVYYGAVTGASSGLVVFQLASSGTGISAWHSTNDFITIAPNSVAGFGCLASGGSVVNVEHLTQTVGGGTGFTPFFVTGSGCHMYIAHSVVVAGTTANALNAGAGALIDDMGGNTFICPGGSAHCVTVGSGGSVRTVVPGSTYISAAGTLIDPPIGTTNCASSASPAVCASWFDGSAVIAAAATTVVVNTTMVGPNSDIVVTRDDSLGTKLGVTCNTQSSLVLGAPRVTARSTGVSFTVAVDVGPTTNPMCFDFSIRGRN